MKTAIFLGAGASRAEGVPTQDELFSSYFSTVFERKNNLDSDADMMKLLLDFFSKTFNINITTENYNKIKYPTFEEVLGILELADNRKDVFYGLRSYNSPSANVVDIVINHSKNKIVHLYLILLITRVLNQKIPCSKGLHKKLLKSLLDKNLLKDTIFLTTNYDTLIDNAIISLEIKNALNYGIDSTNYDQKNGWSKPDDDSIYLYKMHGSLNWLHCPNCNNLTLTKREKNFIHLITDFSKALCPICNSVMFPIIVPPTYFKDLSNVFISSIWNKTENKLKSIDHIIFCGYSFCDADIHVKYLVKRLQIFKENDLKITVFNNYKGKSVTSLKNEEHRYKRFLGENVNFTNQSFEYFIDNVENYLKS